MRVWPFGTSTEVKKFIAIDQGRHPDLKLGGLGAPIIPKLIGVATLIPNVSEFVKNKQRSIRVASPSE